MVHKDHHSGSGDGWFSPAKTNTVVQGDPKTKIVLVETQASETSIKAAIAQDVYCSRNSL